MAKRHQALRRRRQKSGGWLLTFAVVALAAAVCALVSPPRAEDIVAVFGRGEQTSVPAVDALTLPARGWYLVIADGQTVAACGALLEAEIVREGYGEFASIRTLSTEEVALRVTASTEQLAALKKSASALFDTFDMLGRMEHLAQEDAMRTATQTAVSLGKLCDDLDRALRGTENPVVRGLAGLAGSCREAMVDLSIDAEPVRVQKKAASLVLQYEAYIAFLSGDVPQEAPGAAAPTAIPSGT